MQKVAKMTQSCNQIQIINLFASSLSLSNSGTTYGIALVPFLLRALLAECRMHSLHNVIPFSLAIQMKKARLVKPNRILACHIYTPGVAGETGVGWPVGATAALAVSSPAANQNKPGGTWLNHVLPL